MAAEILVSQVLGKPIWVTTVSPDILGERMASTGAPTWMVEHTVSIAFTIRNGGFTPERCQIIREALGREPLSTFDFAQDHKDMFQ